MNLTKEHFDSAISMFATKEDVVFKIDEVLLHITMPWRPFEEGLAPEERLALIEEKLGRIQDSLHIEV
jgi:hypothetical protein